MVKCPQCGFAQEPDGPGKAETCARCGHRFPAASQETVLLGPEELAATEQKPPQGPGVRAVCAQCGAVVSVKPGAGEVRCPECSTVYPVLGETQAAEPTAGGASAAETVATAPAPLTRAAPAGPGSGPSTGKTIASAPTQAAPPDFMRRDPTGLEWLRSNLGDRYEVLEFLGRGGMGAVYKARQRTPSRLVALKVMLGGALVSERARKRFEREAMAAGSIQHPAIVPVYEVGDVAGQPFYTMEFVEGRDLRRYVLEEGLERREVCQLMAEICRAVDFAHTRGIVHRDLKPGNIMVDGEGRCRILDFGLARIAREAQQGEMSLLTVSGDILGTPRYMSPEQATGKPGAVDGRTDVYSLGVMLYELTVGMPPYNLEGLQSYRALDAIRTAPPLRPSQIHPWFPMDLEAILLKALEKEKESRYRTALALAEDLESFLADRPVTAQAPTAAYRLKKFVWRNRRVILPVLAGLFVLAIVGGVLGGLYWGATLKVRSVSADLEAKAGGLRNLKAYVLQQATEGQWEEAFVNAWVAEKSWPGDPAVEGLKDAVHEIAAREVNATVRNVDGLIRAQDYRNAENVANELGALAGRLPFADLERTARQKAAAFREDCWRDLQWVLAEGHAYTRESQIACVTKYLAHFGEGLHAAEAAQILRQLEQAPDSHFLELRLRAVEREMAAHGWQGAAAILEDAEEAVARANVEDKAEWLARFGAWNRALDSVIWSATSDRVAMVRSLAGHEGFVKAVAFRPAVGACVLASGASDALVRVWDAESGELLRSLQGPARGVRSLAFSPDGARLAAGCEDSTMHMWDMADGTRLGWDSGHGLRLQSVSFSPDATVLLAASAAAVNLWDAAGAEPVELVRLAGARAPAVFLPDGDRVAAAAPGGDIGVWRASSGELLQSVPLQSRQAGRLPLSLAVSSDGRFLAAGCRDNSVVVFDLETHGTCVLEGHGRNVDAVAFSPDGRILASAAYDEIRLWRVSTDGPEAKLLRVLEGHERRIQSLAFSPDCRFLASASNDKTACIWGVKESMANR